MRGLWLVVCGGGALVCAIIAGMLAGQIYSVRHDPAQFDAAIDSWAGAILTLVSFAGACVVGLFLKPRQIEELTSEPPPRPAGWLDALRKRTPPR